MDMYGFWRSQATFRVRVALNLKGIAYKEIPVDIDNGAQNEPKFRELNPMGSVPALLVDGESLTQSLAILEYLEETHPEPPLLPKEPLARARVRSLAAIAVSDAHPLIVPRVRRFLRQAASFDAAKWRTWQTQWFGAGLRGYEARLASSAATGSYCHGDTPTFADICLCGLANSAAGFGVRIDDVPTVSEIVGRCMAEPAFEKARAVHQSDYPRQAGAGEQP